MSSDMAKSIDTIKDPYLARKLAKAELHNADDKEINRRVKVGNETRKAGRENRN